MPLGKRIRKIKRKTEDIMLAAIAVVVIGALVGLLIAELFIRNVLKKKGNIKRVDTSKK